MDYRREVLCNVQLFAPVFKWIFTELFSVIRDDLARESKATNNVVPYKTLYLVSRDGYDWLGFDPLGEVVDCNNEKFYSPRRCLCPICRMATEM